ncbi:hypothetical protein BD779DRAFT_1475451 [Infundibulicybe gibba]|nr:hypothetical protein BD779DRAFT_1475451 [Infundibulicybe gibba]
MNAAGCVVNAGLSYARKHLPGDPASHQRPTTPTTCHPSKIKRGAPFIPSTSPRMAGPRRTLTHLASQIDWSMPPIRNTRSHSRMEEWGRWGAPGVELWGIEANGYDISRAYTPAALGTTAPSGGYIPAQRVATVLLQRYLRIVNIYILPSKMTVLDPTINSEQMEMYTDSVGAYIQLYSGWSYIDIYANLYYGLLALDYGLFAPILKFKGKTLDALAANIIGWQARWRTVLGNTHWRWEEGAQWVSPELGRPARCMRSVRRGGAGEEVWTGGPDRVRGHVGGASVAGGAWGVSGTVVVVGKRGMLGWVAFVGMG